MEYLTQRAVIGEYFRRLNQDTGTGWVNMVSNYFESDQASERYAWLGQSPAYREWIGGRNAMQYIEASEDLTDWSVFHTNVPPTTITNWLQYDNNNTRMYFRIRAFRR